MNKMIKLMCAVAAGTVGAATWAGDADLAAWRMAMATNGYVAVEQRVKVPLEVQKAIWNCYRKHIGLEGVQMSRPRLVSTNEFGAVYDLPFVAADGARHNFGVAMDGDYLSPLYFSAVGVVSDPSKASIDALVKDLLPVDVGTAEVLTSARILDNCAVVKGTLSGNRYGCPFDEFHVAFIDDAPLANWGHVARLVFFDKERSSFALSYCNEPIVVLEGGKTVDLKSAEDAVRPQGKLKLASSALRNSPDNETYPALTDGDPSKCYCLLVSGGANIPNNHVRYWNDMCFVYNVLVKRYAVPKANIKVLWAGGNPDADLCIMNGSCSQCSKLNFSPGNLRDFDLDGDDDIDGDATPETVKAALAGYAGSLGASDQLLVLFTDHGGTWPKFNTKYKDQATLCLWRGESYSLDLKDSELAEITRGIKCPVAFVLETCYSGGFIDEILASGSNRFIATADVYDSSYSGNDLMDAWLYHFFSAMCGYYPKKNAAEFWNATDIDVRTKGGTCDADYNGDGRVSFDEAALFAENANFLTAANGFTGDRVDTPKHKESTANLGKKLFLTQYADVPAVVVKEKVLTPALSPASSALGYAPCTVTASCGTSGATIRYTLDGTEPGARSAVYSDGITVSDDTTVSIRAFKSGMEASDVVSVAYKVKKAAPEKPLITSVSQSDSASGIVICWAGGAGTGHYAIRRSESASMSSPVTVADRLPANAYSHLDDTAGAGKDYYYQVVAFNGYGSTASATSQAARRTLSAPATVGVSWVASEKKFRVTWNAVPEATHYRVYRSIDDADPVAVAGWQSDLYLLDVPDAAIGAKIRYYVAAAVSATGQGISSLVPSSVETMPDIRDWQLVIDRYATQKCQMLPGDSKKFDCHLKYSDGTFEQVQFTTGVRWEIVQVGGHVTHQDSDGKYTGASGIGGFYTAPSATLSAESGDYEEEIVLRASYTKNGEARWCDYPIVVSNRRIVSGIYVGVTETYLVPGDEMSVSCSRAYLNSGATGDESAGEATYAIIAGGGAALADDGTLTAFLTDSKTNVTIQVTYRNADGFFTATRQVDISPQPISTIVMEIPALGGYSPTNEIGQIGYLKPGLNALAWTLSWDEATSWVSKLYCRVANGTDATVVLDLGRGNVSVKTIVGTARFAFYADRNDGPCRTETLPFRWNGGGLDVVIRQESAAQVDSPVLSANVGSLNAVCPTQDAVMRYATDGEEPSGSSPVMPGHLSFDGNTECAVKAFAEWMIASDTVYADVVGKDSQWDEVEISFVPVQSGLAAPARRTYAVNETFGELPSFPKTNGLYFKGWTLHEGSEKPVSSTDYVPNQDATLYAVWSPVAADKPSWVALPWNFRSAMTATMKVYDDSTGSYLDPSVCIIGIEDADGVCRGSSENGFGDTQSELNGKNGLSVFGIYSQVAGGTESGLKIRVWNKQKGFMSVVDGELLFTAAGTLGDESNPYVIHVTMNVCEIALPQTGWHLVSFSVLPADPSPAAVFADVADKIDWVVQGSKTWRPGSGGLLTELKIGVGYWVRTKAGGAAWTIVGEPNPGVAIPLSKGWNLVGYPLLESGATATVLNTALDSGKVTRIVSGMKVWQAGSGGMLTELSPGVGYWFYAPEACTISFDGN